VASGDGLISRCRDGRVGLMFKDQAVQEGKHIILDKYSDTSAND
jgi:hypothetical protein